VKTISKPGEAAAVAPVEAQPQPVRAVAPVEAATETPQPSPPRLDWWSDPATWPKHTLRHPDGQRWLHLEPESGHWQMIRPDVDDPLLWWVNEPGGVFFPPPERQLLAQIAATRLAPAIVGGDGRGGPWRLPPSATARADFDAFLGRLGLGLQPEPFERVEPSQEELALRRKFGDESLLLAAARRQMGLPDPRQSLPEDRFGAGETYVAPRIRRTHPDPFPECRPYIIKHILGDWGTIGNATDAALEGLTKACPGAASRLQMNLHTLSTGHGLVVGEHVVRGVPGRRNCTFRIHTLLIPGHVNRTAINVE
jgi:hypothetical protein